MSQFLCKFISLGRYSNSLRNPIGLNPLNPLSLRGLSSESDIPNRHSFTVYYLMNSLGFSHESALLASKSVGFDNPHKPDQAIQFLSGFGFTQTQIPRLVWAFPQILIADPERAVLPKLEFLESKGFSRLELSRKLATYPRVLGSSLEEQIMPRYDYLRCTFASDEKAIRAVRRHPDILINPFVEPNVGVLREKGVSFPNIAQLLCQKPVSVFIAPDQFRKVVEEVAAMGFDASQVKFVFAVAAFDGARGGKANAFKKWGWSDQEVSEAFQRDPRCMWVSEDKISVCLDFLTNQMGWSPRDIANFPRVVEMSLEEKIIPRCLVYQSLLSRGLLKKKLAVATLFKSSNEKFLHSFVMYYKKEAPDLLQLYKSNRESSDQV